MKQYIDLVNHVLAYGISKTDRTGTGTLSTFGQQIELNVANSFPLITTKKVHFKSIAYELLWFISGESSTKFLTDNGVTIWNEWSVNGNLKNPYGVMWRRYPTNKKAWSSSSESYPIVIDQLQNVITEIKINPNSRRLLVDCWNADIIWDNQVSLPYCHYSFQFIIENDNISLKWNQRSVDIGLGLPFNIASYALLLYMVADITGYKPYRIIGSFGDVHIYKNHIEQIKEQIKRIPFELPTLKLTHRNNINDFIFEDFELNNYDFHPHIKMDVAV